MNAVNPGITTGSRSSCSYVGRQAVGRYQAGVAPVAPRAIISALVLARQGK